MFYDENKDLLDNNRSLQVILNKNSFDIDFVTWEIFNNKEHKNVRDILSIKNLTLNELKYLNNLIPTLINHLEN